MGSDNEAPQPTYIGGSMGFRGAAETMSMDGKRRRDYLPGLSESERDKVCYYVVYPNLLLSLHPDYMMIHTLWPRAVDRTEIVCEWYFHPAELAKPDFVADDAIEFWDLTNREDWRIVELSQAGIQSRAYTPGPYSGREELLAAFDQVVIQRDACLPHGRWRSMQSHSASRAAAERSGLFRHLRHHEPQVGCGGRARRPGSFVLWIVAAIFFFLPSAITVAGLSRRFPEEGGMYIWTKRAFGDQHAFLCGWFYFISTVLYLPSLLLAGISMTAYAFGGLGQRLAEDREFATADHAGRAVGRFRR